MHTEFTLSMSPSFYIDNSTLPLSEQKKAGRALKQIKKDPFRGPHIVKIHHKKFNNLYRYKFSESYRFIYCTGKKEIKLLTIGPREGFFDNFHANPSEILNIDIEASKAKPQPIQTVHSDKPIIIDDNNAKEIENNKSAPRRKKKRNDKILLNELLKEWDVSQDHIEMILNCKGIEELIDLEIPNETKDRVLHWSQPTSVKEIIEEPAYELPSEGDYVNYMSCPLKSFLLKLDQDQDKVARKSLVGPTLVKGGPGSGKSLVALYRIRNLLKPDNQRNLFNSEQPRVLFVTYTKSLMSASKQLLESLLGDSIKNVTVTNIDKIVRNIVNQMNMPFKPLDDDIKLRVVLVNDGSCATKYDVDIVNTKSYRKMQLRLRS